MILQEQKKPGKEKNSHLIDLLYVLIVRNRNRTWDMGPFMKLIFILDKISGFIRRKSVRS
jgi:hypothetical protein